MCVSAGVCGGKSCEGWMSSVTRIVFPACFPWDRSEQWKEASMAGPRWFSENNGMFVFTGMASKNLEIKWIQSHILSHKVPSGERAGTCSSAHAPWRQAVGRGKAVEHADVLRCQELHKLGVCKDFPLAVQDGRCLVRDVNNLPRDKRDSHGKYILPIKK